MEHEWWGNTGGRSNIEESGSTEELRSPHPLNKAKTNQSHVFMWLFDFVFVEMKREIILIVPRTHSSLVKEGYFFY